MLEAKPTAEAASEESAEDEGGEELDAGAKAVEDFSNSLRTLEGKWYVLHNPARYEKRVKTNVESRVASFGMEDKIFQIEVPMEEVEKHTEKGQEGHHPRACSRLCADSHASDENARRIVRENRRRHRLRRSDQETGAAARKSSP